MVIKLNQVTYKLPVSLMEISLQERIAYDNVYGRELKVTLATVLEMVPGMDKDVALMEYQADLACKTLSHFGKIPIDIIQDTQLSEVLFIYHEVMKSLSDEVDYSNPAFILEDSFEWQGESWVIHAPEIKHGAAITFGEFLDSKQWVKNLWEFGEDKWEALLMLACVYFRKAGEVYNEELAQQGSERYELLKDLPLQYALHVGFFLSASMSSYLTIYPYLNQGEARARLN